jgi:hypothetical protein
MIFDIYLTTFKLASYNSKCFKENIQFLLLNHNGNRGENGGWIYSPRLCLNAFEIHVNNFFLTLISYNVSMVHLSSHLMFPIKYAFLYKTRRQ